MIYGLYGGYSNRLVLTFLHFLNSVSLFWSWCIFKCKFMQRMNLLKSFFFLFWSNYHIGSPIINENHNSLISSEKIPESLKVNSNSGRKLNFLLQGVDYSLKWVKTVINRTEVSNYSCHDKGEENEEEPASQKVLWWLCAPSRVIF